MLSVVCWKWRPVPGYRSQFGAAQVNTLRSMVERHYRPAHRFICVTDDPAGIDPRVEIVPLWTDHAQLRSPHGGRNPSCYRRLRAFAADAGTMFGARFVSIDLDCVIAGDMAPVWDRPEDFVIWGDTNPSTPYNGSMWLLKAGSRRQVWDRFDPAASPREGLRRGYIGSDQAWIAACLGPNEARWTRRDGVYSYRNEVRLGMGMLPANARVVMFHGQHDPWNADVMRRHQWVRKHYQ